MAVRQRKSSHQTFNVLWTLNHRKTQRKGIHQLTNQTPYFPQPDFKFDPLNFPSGITILWTRVFHLCSHSNNETCFSFICEIWCLQKKNLELPLILFIFKRENKIRKKTLYDSLFGKDMLAKTEFGSEGQVTYWEGTVVSCITPLNPYTYDLY